MIPLFQKYPKQRPELPDAYKKIYDRHYRENRDGSTRGSGLAQKMERWMHRKVAGDIIEPSALPRLKTLEIGAGTLNQLAYEPPHIYDIVEPYTALYSDSPLLSRIRNIYTDISQVPEASRYNRITSVATFEHLTELPAVIARTALLLEPEGSLRAAFPCEGKLLWTLGWTFGTGIEFYFRYRLKYATMMKHEHVNSLEEIIEVLQYFYQDVTLQYNGAGKNLSFYAFVICRLPNIEAAQVHLNLLRTT